MMQFATLLPLPADLGGFKAYFTAAAIRYDGGLVLVDAGLPGFLPVIERVMAEKGLKLGEVNKIIITHHDGDHIGALKAILDKYPDIEVLSSAEQVPYLTGKRKLLRLQIAEERLAASTSDQEKKEMAEEIRRLSRIETIARATPVQDREVLPGSGIEFVEVGGHMPGHLCVYVRGDKTLITGDALTAWEGKLCPPDQRFTLDMPTAIQSLEKLLQYDIENVICYHGGFVAGNIRERLLELIRTGKSDYN